MAKEERYSPCKSTEERGSPLRIPLAQEEQYSEGRPSPKLVPSRNMSLGGGSSVQQVVGRNVNPVTGSAVIYAHRKELAARPRSLQFQAAVKRE